jgi:UPF0755 protein
VVAAAALAAGPAAAAVVPRTFHVVFPEGFTRAQMVARVALDASVANRKLRTQRVSITGPIYARASRAAVVPCFGAGRRTNLEGFLFPSTYAFDVRTSGANLVANQIAAFCSAWDRLDLTLARSRNVTPYGLLTIASMVEAETARPGERAKVAAVIYNRLRLGMPLGIDATLRYALHIPPTASITQADLASSTPYNTRRFKGLPPTPIANPGVASLRAAARPSTLGYLYYARVPGTDEHRFFESAAAYDRFLVANGYGPHP